MQAPADAPELAGDLHKRLPPGSLPFVPPVAGLLMASEIVQDLINSK